MKKGVILLVLFSLLFLGLVSAGVLQVTNEHPFLINGTWIQANQLKVGDLLTTWDGKKARITNIEEINQPVAVYNLEDDIFHNYVADGIIVHNSISKGNLLTDLDLPEIEIPQKAIKTEGQFNKLGLNGRPRYSRNVDDDLVLERIAMLTDAATPSYGLARRYFIAKKIVLNDGLPIDNFAALEKVISSVKEEGTNLKWVIDEDGNLYIGKAYDHLMDQDLELTHAILAGGKKILGGGDMRFTGSAKICTLKIIADPRTGHYVPRSGDISPDQFSKDALEALKILLTQ